MTCVPDELSVANLVSRVSHLPAHLERENERSWERGCHDTGFYGVLIDSDSYLLSFFLRIGQMFACIAFLQAFFENAEKYLENEDCNAGE